VELGLEVEDFKHATYANLGALKTVIKIEGGKYLPNFPFHRHLPKVGIWGWSYGGYMSSHGLMKGKRRPSKQANCRSSGGQLE